MDNLNKLIDHTILRPDATIDEIRKLCIEAKEYGFYSVCVNSAYVNVAYNFLLHSDVKVCSVVGFPLGAMMKEAKAYETKVAVDSGADEIDMVVNVGFLKSKKIDLFERDIKKVRDACHASVLKVIIETCLLTDEEKVLACKIAKECGANFVKTSTGFSTGGATEHDVKLMREAVGKEMGVKASGGIKTYEDAIKMVEAGANRLGTSSGIAIMKSALK
ncbi:deoxyribose-phosphate aldolase [Brachyspira hyodysenteriae]|uniref:Deoxyribose-phosphate aldolase n=1 Tax=Brachyspira hyodysenteriae ATCC 27164 TaxID=1266923 RepID=A0A3B6VS83_BRAHO|nr:deoxyribose-phosphate aldolase [Brachyspira hyodysenteriae]ANN63876.1 deoxyribose-phosphate aldolase [Brachyspira hyodysenteriae ATCC 27164]KLI22487.1 deoxyribose-phosphate aldolase [Brachyspira hyodysenteriae]KLI28117.1 deoxyribose-phosphate aldolase [Brachyspira hyodysenteriae]MCZ9925015.1 deoxyribose-phosphate aldolase [Brachyspira hyodysenteriae]TVL74684.1 deoxyribose-phosphate aldolase [Brachyspira hyodysenteriae]